MVSDHVNQDIQNTVTNELVDGGTWGWNWGFDPTLEELHGLCYGLCLKSEFIWLSFLFTRFRWKSISSDWNNPTEGCLVLYPVPFLVVCRVPLLLLLPFLSVRERISHFVLVHHKLTFIPVFVFEILCRIWFGPEKEKVKGIRGLEESIGLSFLRSGYSFWTLSLRYTFVQEGLSDHPTNRTRKLDQQIRKISRFCLPKVEGNLFSFIIGLKGRSGFYDVWNNSKTSQWRSVFLRRVVCETSSGVEGRKSFV